MPSRCQVSLSSISCRNTNPTLVRPAVDGTYRLDPVDLVQYSLSVSAEVQPVSVCRSSYPGHGDMDEGHPERNDAVHINSLNVQK